MKKNDNLLSMIIGIILYLGSLIMFVFGLFASLHYFILSVCLFIGFLYITVYYPRHRMEEEINSMKEILRQIRVTPPPLDNDNKRC